MTEIPQDLTHAHHDGYRVGVSYSADADKGMIELNLVYICHNYTMWQHTLLQEKFDEETCFEALLPKFRRLEKLLQAFARYFNEGGDEKAVDLLLAMNGLCKTATVTAELVATESEETHARTFLLDNGNYLHVVEDEFTEVMTPAEMQHAHERDQRQESVDVTGLGLDLL